MTIKKKELKGMSIQELNNKLSELKKEKIKNKAQVATGTIPKSPGQVKVNKKTIARIMTIINQKVKTKEE